MTGFRVVKVGGSLLDLADLPQRIQKWLASHERKVNVFLIGGGEICNEMRRLDARFKFDAAFSHDCCIDLMKVTARVLSQILILDLIQEYGALVRRDEDAVFDCGRWLEQMDDRVPRNWDFTSDSISALLAQEMNAELCLLKSVNVDEDEATDNCFEQFSQGIKVDFVNLRTIELT